MQDINGDKKCLMDKKAAFSVSLPNSTINEITAQCPDGMSPARWKELIIRRGLQALTASVMDTDMERLKSEMELQCKQSMDALKGSHASDMEDYKNGNKLFSFIDANVMLYLDELCDKYDMDRKKGIFTCIKYSLHCEKTHLFRRSFQSFIKQ